jgi:hypothetical protein
MKGLVFALCLLGLAAAPTLASAQDAGGAAGDTAASSSSLSPVTWGLISAGVVGTIAGVAVAVNSSGGGHGGTTTTTTTTTTN